jgi:hypothetical protein
MLVDPATAIAVPPQLFESPFGVATTNPAGNVSVNATPASATEFAAGLVTVKVRDVVPFNTSVAAPKALAIDGGATTARLADAVPPVPPFAEATAPVVLLSAPAAVPITFTVKLHEELAVKAAPDRVALLDPAVAVIVPPPQLPLKPLGVATTMPEGNVSVKPTPVSAVPALVFDTVKVNVVLPFNATLAAPNDFVMVGDPSTVTVAVLLVAPAPLWLEETAPVVLAWAPAVIPTTLTPNVHDPLEAIVAPARLRLPVPAVAINVPPPQLPVKPFGVEINKPAGKLSLKATPVSDVTLAIGLVIVKLRVVEALSGIVAAPNVLLIVGADTTPVPVSPRVCGLLPAPSVMVSVPVRAPAAPGVKFTVIVQVELLGTATLVLHVPPGLAKSPLSAPVKVMLDMDSELPLWLVSVTVLAGLLVLPTP